MKGTVLFFLDGTGRYIFLFSRRDGTLGIFFHCTGDRNAKHTALGTKAAVLQVKVIRRIIYIIIRYHTCSIMGIDL